LPITFPKALETGTLKEIRTIPKSDLHNHCLMGGRVATIEKFYGKKLSRFKPVKGSIHELDRWIIEVYRPFFMDYPDAFRKAVEAAFLQARSDGVKVLEMSLDIGYAPAFQTKPGQLVEILKQVHQSIAPGIDYRPELGFMRGQSIRTLIANLEPYLDLNYFKSVDLYDDEFAQPIRNFREVFRYVKRIGLKCKAHAGEFGDADSVKETVEELELDEVQHGIAAAASPAVMYWLADHHIRLNVCPASNIRLKRVRSYKTHPIRMLFDHGIQVTINTDDVLIFGAGVSEQMKRLYTCGLFTSAELDVIRMNGLEETRYKQVLNSKR